MPGAGEKISHVFRDVYDHEGSHHDDYDSMSERFHSASSIMDGYEDPDEELIPPTITFTVGGRTYETGLTDPAQALAQARHLADSEGVEVKVNSPQDTLGTIRPAR